MRDLLRALAVNTRFTRRGRDNVSASLRALLRLQCGLVDERAHGLGGAGE